MENKLAIGICAYKRPGMLHHCLNSLNDMDRPQDVELSIIIADNDRAASSKSTVEESRSKIDINLYYQIEPGRGIPYARNNVLKQAKELGVTELAFIDDDEYVKKDWLVNFWNYYINSEADVVRGLVKTVYPPDTPKWIIKGEFYQRSNHPTGTVFHSSNTGNVLFNYKKLISEWKLDFDETYGTRGGSDTDFFKRANANGALINWVSNAVVYETLTEERFRLGFLLRRKFRTRNHDKTLTHLTLKKWINIFIRSVYIILKGIILLPLNSMLGKHRLVLSLVHIVSGVAKLLGLFKINVKWEEYKK